MYNIEEETWKKRASLCEPRTSVCTVVLDGHIFALGGHNGLLALSSVEKYDPDSNVWSPTTGKPLIYGQVKNGHLALEIIDINIKLLWRYLATAPQK